MKNYIFEEHRNYFEYIYDRDLPTMRSCLHSFRTSLDQISLINFIVTGLSLNYTKVFMLIFAKKLVISLN